MFFNVNPVPLRVAIALVLLAAGAQAGAQDTAALAAPTVFDAARARLQDAETLKTLAVEVINRVGHMILNGHSKKFLAADENCALAISQVRSPRTVDLSSHALEKFGVLSIPPSNFAIIRPSFGE